jgi:hypothetical protein
MALLTISFDLSFCPLSRIRMFAVHKNRNYYIPSVPSTVGFAQTFVEGREGGRRKSRMSFQTPLSLWHILGIGKNVENNVAIISE